MRNLLVPVQYVRLWNQLVQGRILLGEPRQARGRENSYKVPILGSEKKKQTTMVGSVSTLPGDQNHVSNEKKTQLLWVYSIWGDYTTQLYGIYFKADYKDPFQTTSIMESTMWFKLWPLYPLFGGHLTSNSKGPRELTIPKRSQTRRIAR